MLKLISALFPFLNRRSPSRFGRPGALAQRLGGRRGGMALGTIASIAAPFVIRKLMVRREQRAASRAY